MDFNQETQMKTTRLILFIALLALAACGRRTTTLSNGLGMPDPFSNNSNLAEPIASGDSDEESEQANNSNSNSNGSSTGSDTSSSSSSNTSGESQQSTYTAPVSSTTAITQMVKKPVYRSVQTYLGNRYWTGYQPNVAAVTAYGYAYEGVAFQVAAGMTNDCGISLYTCLIPSLNQYAIHHQSNCGGNGNVMVEFLGYACNAGTSTPTIPLFGMQHPGGWLFYTTSLAEVNIMERNGYFILGAYYTPY